MKATRAILSFSLILGTIGIVLTSSEDENGKLKPLARKSASKALLFCKYPVGDHRCCLQRNDNKGLLRMEVLPGTGWDDLRDLNMGMVVWKNYSQCLTSEDGKYLIPDNTFVVAVKESNVVLNSEYFDHWNNYSSMTSNSISAGAHGSIFGFGLGGKFSSEYESVKKHQVEDKAVTTRVQLRYKFYTVKAQPDMQLHPGFKSRLLDIAANLQCNNTAMARYMADLLVRDYGTHYVTSVDAGAILAKIDHIKSTYAATFQRDKSKITASASASFFGLFGPSIRASYDKKADKKDLNTFRKNIVQSKIVTHGGPPYRANFSISQWEDDLANNLVAIDRSGDPLHYVITHEVLPELPESLTRELSRFVLRSIKSYYKHNSIKGCTDASSPNFNFQAILDDHSCKSPYTNFTFGGVYQTCSVSGSPSSNPCGAFQQKNPKKNDYACPDGYDAILFHQGRTPKTCHKTCHGWWIFKSCHDDCGYAKWNAYWCVATGPAKDHSGYLFGGLYTKIAMNPVTGTASCPHKFYPQRFGPEGMYVCISDDYELAAQYSLPFAGFFSCSAGNPLALKNAGSGIKGLAGSFLHNATPSKWPKRCPTGYSQHLAIIDEDCEINYCVIANSLSVHNLPSIKRPPFRSPPKMNHNSTIPLTIINDDEGKVWFKDPNSLEWILAKKSALTKSMPKQHIDEDTPENSKASSNLFESHTKSSSSVQTRDSMSPGTVVAIVIVVIGSAALLMLIGFLVRLRCKHHRIYFTPVASSSKYQIVGNDDDQLIDV